MKRKTTYEQVIDFLETHNGKLMKSNRYISKRHLKIKEMTDEHHEEMKLYARWKYSKENKILGEYAGQPIENVPEEYREKIEKLRSYGLGLKKKRTKTTYEEVIDFLETHNGELMKRNFYKSGNPRPLKKNEMTEKQIDEVNLASRWKDSPEFKILKEYVGKPIEEVPEEYREKIEKLRSYGLGIKEKSTKPIYEQVIEHLETHNGILMKCNFYKNGRRLKINEMTPEQEKERMLYTEWINSQEYKIFKEYVGQPIEKVPEEYREKIEKLRSYGIDTKRKASEGIYEQVIEYLDTHNGKMPRSNFYKNGRRLKVNEMTPEQKKEAIIYFRWYSSPEFKILKEYEGQPIENVPEEYREKIEKLRRYGLGIKEKRTKTTYEEVIEHLDTHNGKMPRNNFYKNGRRLKVNEMTPEQKKEVNLFYRWLKSKEYKILKKYVDKPIEDVPEEYRERIEKLRSYGLGMKEKGKKTTYEEVIDFLETHNGKIMRGRFARNNRSFKRSELTDEEHKEIILYSRWRLSKELAILEKYAGQQIENVPEEYREKIEKLRSYGLGMKEKSTKTTYEQVIEYLDTHNGKIMRGIIYKNRANLKSEEMTLEQREELNLYYKFHKSPEFKILKEYAGQPIENVPEEYREKIEKLRSYGLIIKEKRTKTTYEQVIEYLETHNGKMMRAIFYKNSKPLKRTEMTPEQKKEIILYYRWYNSPEFKILKEYEGQPIGNVPKEYREKIKKLRSYGLGLKKSKISEAKQERDKAKNINDKAKELENNVADELKKISDKFKEADER